jgi:hypothetical protein
MKTEEQVMEILRLARAEGEVVSNGLFEELRKPVGSRDTHFCNTAMGWLGNISTEIMVLNRVLEI